MPGSVTQIFTNPSVAGPDMEFGNGQTHNSQASFFPTLPDVPGPLSSWKLIEWDKTDYIDPSADETDPASTYDPLYGDALYSWATPDGESAFSVYQSGRASDPYVYDLQESGGVLHTGGGANIYLSSGAIQNTTFAYPITYSVDARITQAEISYNTAAARSNGAVLAQIYTGFTIWFNQPGTSKYDSALPSFLLYLQLNISHSGSSAGGGAGYRSASLLPYWTSGSAQLTYNSTLPGDQFLPFAAAGNPTTLTYNLNDYLEDVLTQPWPVKSTSGTYTNSILPRAASDLSLWTLGSMYIGLETESSDGSTGSTNTLPQGTVTAGLQISNISVTQNTSQLYSPAGFNDQVRSSSNNVTAWPVTISGGTVEITSQSASQAGAVSLAGTVTNAAGATVKIYDGTILLGTAAVSDGTWSFSQTVGIGSYTLHAVMTDAAGDTATSTNGAAFVVSAAATSTSTASSSTGPLQVQSLNGSTATAGVLPTLFLLPAMSAGTSRHVQTIANFVAGGGGDKLSLAATDASDAQVSGLNYSDILWLNGSSAPIVWDMNGSSIAAGAIVGAATPGYHIIGVGDFDGDGNSDILWSSNAGGPALMWLMNGSHVAAAALLPGGSAPKAWIGDFNGDAKSDILWDMGSGRPVLEEMSGTHILSAAYVGAATPGYHIAGIGDFNGDGNCDILWSSNAGGPALMWLMNGSQVTAAALLFGGSVPKAWIGDFNGDAKSDILWDMGSGRPVLEEMSGTSIISAAFVGTATPGYHIAGVGDFNGDGNSDILWAPNTGSSNDVVWLMNGGNVSSSVVLPYGAGVPSAAIGNFKVDGTKITYGGGNQINLPGVSQTSFSRSANLEATATTDSYAASNTGVTASLQTGQSSVAGDVLAGVVNLTGSTCDDSLTGNAQDNILVGGGGTNTLVGAGGSDTYQFSAADVTDSIENGVSGNSGPTGTLDMAVAHDDLWFVQEGSNLDIDVIGTTRQAVIVGWYANDSAHVEQLSSVVASDGYRIDGLLQQLVQAMATYSGRNSAFDPQVTGTATPFDPALQSTIAAAWHTS